MSKDKQRAGFLLDDPENRNEKALQRAEVIFLHAGAILMNCQWSERLKWTAKSLLKLRLTDLGTFGNAALPSCNEL
jgi:hypothetical protein